MYSDWERSSEPLVNSQGILDYRSIGSGVEIGKQTLIDIKSAVIKKIVGKILFDKNTTKY